MIDGEISQISQMMQLLCLPQSCVVGPLTFKEFEDILSGDTTLPPRHTWIIIVKTNALSLDEVVSPAEEESPTLAAEECPSSPIEPVQPYETMFGNFFQAEEAEDELLRGLHPAPVTANTAATPAALPRTMQPHHFVVAFRRDGDTQLAPTLHPGDFRGRGQPSPAVHQLPAAAPMHTPGLPSGVTFDSFRPY